MEHLNISDFVPTLVSKYELDILDRKIPHVQSFIMQFVIIYLTI